MLFSVRMTEQEQQLANFYAKTHGITVEEAMKSAFFEMIEDEMDLASAEIALKEFGKNPVTYSMAEAREILGI